MATRVKVYPSPFPYPDESDEDKVLTVDNGEVDWEVAPTSKSEVSTLVLTAENISSKSVSLPFIINEENYIDFDIPDGPDQAKGIDFDFDYDLNKLIWGGLGLDGILTEGDTIQITYLVTV